MTQILLDGKKFPFIVVHNKIIVGFGDSINYVKLFRTLDIYSKRIFGMALSMVGLRAFIAFTDNKFA